VSERFRQRHAHSLGRRWFYGLRQRWRGAVPKSQQVFLVDYRGHRYKRIVFVDSCQAERVADSLLQGPLVDIMPRLVWQYDCEVWVEYLDGRSLDPQQLEHRAQLSAFFLRLYGGALAQQQSVSPAAYAQQLDNDLWFLARAAVIDEAQQAGLRALGERCMPAELLLGYDYVDPVAKNFLMTSDEQLRVIDIESLLPDSALGTGLAKARLHWLHDPAELLSALAAIAPAVVAQQDFVYLCLLAGWTKRKLLMGKSGHVQPARFARLLERKL
jgi:hypothetical protein